MTQGIHPTVQHPNDHHSLVTQHGVEDVLAYPVRSAATGWLSLAASHRGSRDRFGAGHIPRHFILAYRWVIFLSIATLFVVVGTGVFVLSTSGEGSAVLLGMSMAAALALLSAGPGPD